MWTRRSRGWMQSCSCAPTTTAAWRGSGRSTRLFVPIASRTRLWCQVPATRTALEQSWSGRRASNPLPRPWQGRALPSELLPLGQRKDHNPAREPLSLSPPGFSLEDLFDLPLERPRQRERKRKAWVVLTGLDCIHRLPRNAQPLREVGLRPCQLCPQHPQAIFHRWRHLKTAAPSAHRIAISGRT